MKTKQVDNQQFYKATQTNGTDFYSGTIHYEVGRTVRPHPYVGERRLCGPGVLHASTVPTETLVGGSWPCRLFLVEGKPSFRDDLHPHKRGFKQLKVAAELEASEVFGPQGGEVAALIARVGRITPAEAQALDAALSTWREAARGAALSTARGAARDAASRWAAWSASWREAARGAALDAAWCAAVALVVRDLITPEEFDLLYGPWASVIE